MKCSLRLRGGRAPSGGNEMGWEERGDEGYFCTCCYGLFNEGLGLSEVVIHV